VDFLKLVTLSTSIRKQNYHQFKKVDDAPKKNIELTALLQNEIRLTGIDKPGSPNTFRHSFARFRL